MGGRTRHNTRIFPRNSTSWLWRFLRRSISLRYLETSALFSALTEKNLWQIYGCNKDIGRCIRGRCYTGGEKGFTCLQAAVVSWCIALLNLAASSRKTLSSVLMLDVADFTERVHGDGKEKKRSLLASFLGSFSVQKSRVLQVTKSWVRVCQEGCFQWMCKIVCPAWVLCTCAKRRVDLGDGRDGSSGLSPPPLLCLPYCYQAVLLRGIQLRLQLTTHLFQTTIVSKAPYSEVVRHTSHATDPPAAAC